ncbi:unnamed protein product [Orchesella dallaii]|uniref:Uncharacterized protein n=1 Tax=Orchesella dallaii TaxID=48710 RepID=A0ABP1PJH8_9HEXA
MRLNLDVIGIGATEIIKIMQKPIVCNLVLISFCLLDKISSIEIVSVLPFLSTTPENYVVHLFENPKLQVTCKSTHPNTYFQNILEVPFLRLMVFSKFENFVPRKPYRRFAEEYNIIISPYRPSKFKGLRKDLMVEPIQTFKDYSMHIYTFYIFISRKNFLSSETVDRDWQHSITSSNVPAGKIILNIPCSFTPPYNISKSNATITIVCNRLCITKTVPFTASTSHSLTNIVRFHRSHFRKLNGGKISTVIENTGYYIKKFPNDPYACHGNEHRLHHFCHSDLMSVVSLSKHHNFSLSLFGSRDLRGAKQLDYSDHGQIIRTTSSFLSYNLPTYLYMHRLPFKAFSRRGIQYCKNLKKEALKGSGTTISRLNHFPMWTKPFTINIWTVTTVWAVTGTLMFARSFQPTKLFAGLLSFIITILGHSEGTQSTIGYFNMFTGVMGMVLCNLYGNEMTSYVIVARPPKPIQTIEEFLNQNFKIVWDPKARAKPPYIEYKSEFKMLNLSERLNQSFHAYEYTDMSLESNKNSLKYLDEKLTKDMVKLGIDFDSFDKYSVLKMTFLMKNVSNNNDYRCYSVKQRFSKKLWHWFMYIINGHWIVETNLRMTEAGLPTIWDEWARWGDALRGNILQEYSGYKDLEPPNFIEIYRISPMVIVWLVLCTLAVILFCLEKSIYIILHSTRTQKFEMKG